MSDNIPTSQTVPDSLIRIAAALERIADALEPSDPADESSLLDRLDQICASLRRTPNL